MSEPMDEELARLLAAFTEALGARVEVWRVVMEQDGTESERLYRGSYQPALPTPAPDAGDKQ